MLTSNSNTTLEEIAQLLREKQTFAICGHINPDGDCMGSELALGQALETLGKSVAFLLAKDEPLDQSILSLPGSEKCIPACCYQEDADVFIAVDVPTRERIGLAQEVADRAGVRVTLDHHAVEVVMSEYNYVDPDSPSTTMIVWELIELLQAENPASAQCALCGLITDTGKFSYQNTTAQAFEYAARMVAAGAHPAAINRSFFQNRSLASLRLEERMLAQMQFDCYGQFSFAALSNADFEECQARKPDAEVLIDVLRDIAGVRVALILREAPDGAIRGSLRAKDDSDVAQVARFFGGGGHRAAAGFSFEGSLDEALEAVCSKVKELIFA